MILPLATITRLQRNFYEVWFNIDAPKNSAEVDIILDEDERQKYLSVTEETNFASGYLNEIPQSISRTTFRNVFNVSLQGLESRYMRFTFFLSEIMVKVEDAESAMSLAEYARRNSIQFIGGEGKTATIFVHVTGQRVPVNVTNPEKS